MGGRAGPGMEGRAQTLADKTPGGALWPPCAELHGLERRVATAVWGEWADIAMHWEQKGASKQRWEQQPWTQG